MQRLLILLIYTVFQRYILSFTAEPLEGWKKIMWFLHRIEFLAVSIYSWQPVAGCFLVGMWEKRNFHLKKRKKINWVASAALWIITPPLITHPWALCARLRLGDDGDSCPCTSVGGQPDLQDSLLTGTGTAVLAGCLPEASIDTRVLVWITGSRGWDSPLLINWARALINDTFGLPPLCRRLKTFVRVLPHGEKATEKKKYIYSSLFDLIIFKIANWNSLWWMTTGSDFTISATQISRICWLELYDGKESTQNKNT